MMPTRGEDDALIEALADLNRRAIRWLGTIILAAVLGLILLAVVDAGFWSSIGVRRAEVDSDGGLALRGTQTDQAVAILGNIASAGIGGLVGWVTRDFVVRRRNTEIEAGPHLQDKDT